MFRSVYRFHIPYFRGLVPWDAYQYFEVFGGVLNQARALIWAGALIKTCENLNLPFSAHTRTLFIIYDN